MHFNIMNSFYKKSLVIFLQKIVLKDQFFHGTRRVTLSTIDIYEILET